MELLLGMNQTRVLSVQPDGPIEEVGQAVKLHIRMRGFTGGSNPAPIDRYLSVTKRHAFYPGTYV